MAKKGRKRKLDSEDIAMVDWEKEHIMSDELHKEMKTMWELPQIYHFLHLTKEALNIGPLSMYEMERMLLMPRASKQLAHIMTCLLSSPMLKTKLRRIPPMPYEYWTNILTHKIKSWFKIYHNKHEDTVKVLEATGVEPEFWKIFPDVALIEGKDFEELTFRQRVWLLKTVCDAMMHARKTVQEEMAKQLTEEPSETLLGIDRHGARYIYFPQIMENDVRVYRHCLDNKILSTVKPPKKIELKSEVKTDNKKTGLLKSSRSRRRKCRWRNGSLPPRIRKRVKRQNENSNCEYTAEGVAESLGSEDTNLSSMSICSNNNHSDLGSERSKRSRSSSKNSEESVISNQTKSSHAKSSGYDTNTSNDTKSNDEMPFRKGFQGFSKDTDTAERDLTTKDTILENRLTVERQTEESETGSTKTTELTTENAEKIAEQSNVVSVKCKSTDGDADVINKNDSQSNMLASFNPESNATPTVNKISDDAPLNCTHSIAALNGQPRTDDVITSLKELSGTGVLDMDELSSSSKTDDEKLNDIMSIDGSVIDASKNTANMTSPIISKETISEGVKIVENEVNIENILSVSKSDDQKLIETKLKDGRLDDTETIDGTSNEDTTPAKPIDALSSETSTLDEPSDNVKEKEEEEEDQPATRINYSTKDVIGRNFVTRSTVKSKIDVKSDEATERRPSNRPRRNVRSTYQRLLLCEDAKSECSSDQEPSLSELRDRLLKENKEDSTPNEHCDVPVWEKYNLRKPKKIKKEEAEEKRIENFHEMLGDLSISSFELVADSIEALREEVLTNILGNNSEEVNDVSVRNNYRPQCELRLTKKIHGLLAELEKRESSLTDATKKARAKLHKEWTNFKEGVVEDQDWSSEGSLALGSNWWVIGSQGCPPLPPTGDATISPLSQLTLPPLGTRHQPQFPDDPKRERTDQDELQEDNAKQQRSQRASGDRGETQEDTAGEQEEQRPLQENSRRNEEAGDKSEKETDLSSRRVLRARGVSSYMEQVFTSDDDVEEDELERWPDVEAKYAPACTSPNPPATHGPSTSGQAETWESEDSDQDWILPCARKRKSKRSVPRKLKSLQQRLQHINGEVAEPNISPPLVEKPTDQTENRTDSDQTNQKHTTSSNLSNPIANEEPVSDVRCSQAVPSTPICRIESVHSEIDIKDEVALPSTDQSQNLNNYNVNVQPAGYVVVKTEQGPMTNYYLMPQSTSVPSIVQQSTIMPSIVPQVQQGYYVQAGQNYIVQAPQQANFLTTQTLQPNPQPIIAPQARQQLLQHTLTHNYMPMPGYVVQPPPVHPSGPRGFIVNQGMQPHFIPTQNIGLGNQLNVRNRPPLVGNGMPFPHGAVIRSSVPLRGNVGRGNSRVRSKNLAPRMIAPQLANPQPVQNNKRASRVQNTSTSTNATKNTTSLIVLSDSDDEIEMIITEKTKPVKAASTANISSQETVNVQIAQKPVVTSHVTVSPGDSILPPQIMQRMSQGGISITPVKNPQSQAFQNPSTHLVVVVNETGSHYALSLPNGSKLILTPDQVAQIRASNNGKLML